MVAKGISLAVLPLTVTTWRDWKRNHPLTSVVSPETGYRRDYSPGKAYGRYFASPELMFPVWKRDAAMAPKTWIYGLRRGGVARAYPLETLFYERVVSDTLGDLRVVLVADPEAGWVRAYERGGHSFSEGPGAGALVEPSSGLVWRAEEEGLVASEEGSTKWRRLAGHRAYWFGWYAFFPDTSLYGGCTPSDAGGQ